MFISFLEPAGRESGKQTMAEAEQAQAMADNLNAALIDLLISGPPKSLKAWTDTTNV
jgi:hypothetical protein